MKSHISKVRIAALAVGLAIVMSSCGIQNQAGDSSGASGKTKNYALTVSGYCWDDFEQWNQMQMAFWQEWIAGAPGVDLVWDQGTSKIISSADPAYAQRMTDASLGLMPTNDPNWWAGLSDGVPCPAGVEAGEINGKVSVSAVNVKSCLKPEVKQAMIDGYTEQLARPLGGEVTEEYLAKMQTGLDVTKATCTNQEIV